MSGKDKEQSSGWMSTLGTIGSLLAAAGVGAVAYKVFSEDSAECSQNNAHSRQYSHKPQFCNLPPKECLICLEELNLTRLPCGHYYHVDCIKQLENYKKVCPACRAPF